MSTLFHFENGRDVSVYFMLGKLEMRALFPICRNMRAQVKKSRLICWGQNTFFFFFTGAIFFKKIAPINQFTGAILGFTGAI